MESAEKVLETVEALLLSVKRLEKLYPERRFTLDGHLVGSIGEVLAAELYGLDLLPASTVCHDAVCPGGRNVQVKLTQVHRIGISSEPDYLLVLKLSPEGTIEEVYNGPGAPAWAIAGQLQKNGQRSISLNRLRLLGSEVTEEDRISLEADPGWFSKLGQARGTSAKALRPGTSSGRLGDAER